MFKSITGLHAITDNTAETALDMFIDAILEHGVPSRVWGDRGGENRDISILMILFHGLNHASFMWGPSVFNTQIERLWLEVGKWFVCQWHAFFFQLERYHLLKQQDQCHHWLLHYLFLGFINEDCEKFCEQMEFSSNLWSGWRVLSKCKLLGYYSHQQFDSHLPSGPCISGRIGAWYLWWLWRFDQRRSQCLLQFPWEWRTSFRWWRSWSIKQWGGLPWWRILQRLQHRLYGCKWVWGYGGLGSWVWYWGKLFIKLFDIFDH